MQDKPNTYTDPRIDSDYKPVMCYRTLQPSECDKDKCQRECWRKGEEDEQV